MLAFDWYQATVPAGVDDVLEALGGLSEGLQLSHQRGMHGYAHTAVLGTEADGPVAKVMYGGTHEYPHAQVTGDWAQAGAEVIRASFPRHTVARLDVRQDFGDEGAFDAIQPHLLAAAAQHRVKVGTAGDHLLTFKGRTTYLGSPSSAVRLRLYDKAAEIRSKMAQPEFARMLGVPEHLARLEAQIRPHTRESKERFASIEPVEALGCARWMREVWKAVAGLDLTPVQVGRGYRQADHDRAYRYALAQYARVFLRMREDLGSWECVGLQLGHDLAETRKPT